MKIDAKIFLKTIDTAGKTIYNTKAVFKRRFVCTYNVGVWRRW